MDKVTIARYDMWPHAEIARGRLESEGIDAWLMDENLVQTDWLYSIAVGGIKLQVRPADVEAAKQILATDYSALLDDIDVENPD